MCLYQVCGTGHLLNLRAFVSSYVKWDDIPKIVQMLRRHVLNECMNTGLDVGQRVNTSYFNMSKF